MRSLVQKSVMMRAGIKALEAISDASVLAVLKMLPALNTARFPKN